MAEETYATLRELDDVKQDIRDIRHIVSNIDAGTREVIGLQASLTDLTKDLTEMKADLRSYVVSHENRHKEETMEIERRKEVERRERITTRRWIIGACIAIVTAVGGLYGFMSVILQHIH